MEICRLTFKMSLLKIIPKHFLSNILRKTHLNAMRYSSYNVDLSIGDLSLNKYIDKLRREHEILSRETIPVQRLHELQPVIDLLNQRSNLISNINNLNELLNDVDDNLRRMAEEERSEFENTLRNIDKELQITLLPMDDEDRVNEMVLEVSAGVGGQEAMLFASEMLDMYSNYAEFKGWDVITAEHFKTEGGGIRHGSLIISGIEVFKHFKHEAGVHRVQRVPSTEKSGRIHTSTVSVLALPQPDDIQITIESKDLKIETKRATGAGGQHVNTTDSAVRVVHLPTGISIECQTDRSQIKNKQIALQRLRAKLYEQQLQAQMNKLEATKKSQVRTNFRNEKIRTYNFGQDRITDHRLEGHNVHNLKTFLLGGEPLDGLIQKIDHKIRLDRLKEMVK